MNSQTEIIDELSRWIVGRGIITMALFPLALPILILTVIAAIPFVLIALAGALAATVVIFPVLLVRGLGRRAIRALRRRAPRVQRGPETPSGSAGLPAREGVPVMMTKVS